MNRIKALSRYQKAVLLFILVMVAVFTVLYPLTCSRVGLLYHDAILLPDQQNGGTVYAGEIQGEDARFTVSADKTVTFQYGSQTYGPYTAREDPAAIPQDHAMNGSMTGVVLSCGGEVLFRGGVLEQGDYLLLIREDGTLEDLGIIVTTNNGVTIVENGEVVDPMEPSASIILELMDGPQLTHKGNWIGWCFGVAICLLAVASILFADELFRFNLSFQIRNVDDAEPSDWEIAERYISWTVLPIGALVLFIWGLRAAV